MIRRVGIPALVAIAAVSGTVVLIGYFFRVEFIENLRIVFLNWFVILAAIALGVGTLNLISVHVKKVQNEPQQWINSLVLIASFAITAVLSLFLGFTSSASVWILNYILLPIEASLVAVIAVFLIFTLGRMIFQKKSLFISVFIFTVLFTLALDVLDLWTKSPVAANVRDWINHVWSLGGIRAILIGIALGAITTGLRVILGAERPYES